MPHEPHEPIITALTTFIFESPYEPAESFWRGFIAGMIFNLSGAADERFLQALFLFRGLAWSAFAFSTYCLVPVAVTERMDNKIAAFLGLVFGSIAGLLTIEVRDLMVDRTDSAPPFYTGRLAP
jgi:hypothetical protein